MNEREAGAVVRCLVLACLYAALSAPAAGLGNGPKTSQPPGGRLGVEKTRSAQPAALPVKSQKDGVALPPGAGTDWLSRVQSQIQADEYQVTWVDRTSLPDKKGAWQAPNRAQGFRTYFTGEGIRVAPRSEATPSWQWGLELVRWGREGALKDVSPAKPHAESNRVTLDRQGIQEWYINSPEGLEQGFTISVPPAGLDRRGGAPSPPADVPATNQREGAVALPGLLLDLALTGTLHPKFAEGGQAVDFYDSGNFNIIHYAKLKVTDATGRLLPAHFEGWVGSHSQRSTLNHQLSKASSGGIRIAIDDTGATYPITVDPLATGPAWMAAGEASGDDFGYCVATAGDVNGDGCSDVLVGAHGYNSNNGKAYLYMGGPSGLSVSPSWTASGETTGDHFGWSVATAGDVNGDGYADVLVGAFGYPGFNCTGKTNLYLGSTSGLSTSPAWTATGEAASNYFGYSMATAGDVNGDGYADVVVGAVGNNSYRGKAYVYLGGASGLSANASWTAEGQALSGAFGVSVAMAGDVNGDGYSDVIVGADWTGAGRAYVYLGSASGLAASPAWTAAGEGFDDDFGCSVATAGDVNGDGYADVIVGADGYASSTGKAYVYLGSATGPSASPAWITTGEAAGDLFGISVATVGDVNGDGYSDVIIGAYSYSGGTGKAYLYLGGLSGLSPSPTWTATGGATSDCFGRSVATAGDVNGDGYSDVVVGAYGNTSSTGKAYLYLGGASGLSVSPSWTTTGEAVGDGFGISVATAGDVNGDGYSDVIIGAHGNADNAGKAYLYLGGPSGLSTTYSWTAAGEAASDNFGYSVATAGDVSGDGYSDVIVGAYGNAGNMGKAYLYLGGPSGLSTASSWTAAGEAALDDFGYSVATAGDVNGDGYSDVIIGAHGNADNAGKAYLYLGGPSGLSTASSWTTVGEASGDDFGYSVATAGDVNGDGYSDVIVGAPYNSGNTGKAYLYLGGPSGLSTASSWTTVGEASGDDFGGSAATAGDVNGDGYLDVIVGAYGNTSNTGKAYLYLGEPSGLSGASSWTAAGEAADDNLGNSVSTAGDVNGDGYSDVIVGAYGNNSNAGKAYMYFGGGGPGVPLKPQQLRADLTAPIAPLGLALEQQFRIALLLRTPYGRGNVQLQWQAVPLWASFAPALNPIQSDGTWLSSGTAGANQKELVTLPDPPGPCKWRVRLGYHPATTPFQSFSRWLTSAANGLQETDLLSLTQVTCVLPDEPCWLYQVDKIGTDCTLNWQDPNQSNQRTGWNIRRSNNAGLPKSTWPVVGSNVVDMDAGTPNYQWTDHSGADPGPGGVWYYQVTTYNANCPAEGPF